MSHNYPAKILLFGEYAVVKGGTGIALPLGHFFGKLEKTQCKDSPKLTEFCDYLSGSRILSKAMDLKRFEADIHQGLSFQSNIPQGYGVGSSGALCAAVYAEYAFNFTDKGQYSEQELDILKDEMALMESYYHGTSSGLDCLISLIKLPILVKDRNKIDVIEMPNLKQFGEFTLFDSGKARKTSTFVHEFLSKYDSSAKYKDEVTKLVHINNKLIDGLYSHDKESFADLFYQLSRLQYLNFNKMIPDSVKEVWLQGLESKKYFMKLCGAGGGGFFIKYSPEKNESGELSLNRYL